MFEPACCIWWWGRISPNQPYIKGATAATISLNREREMTAQPISLKVVNTEGIKSGELKRGGGGESVHCRQFIIQKL